MKRFSKSLSIALFLFALTIHNPIPEPEEKPHVVREHR